MTTDTVGGVFTYTLELVDALARHDIEVTIATMGRPLRDGQRRELEACPARDVYESHFALEWMDDAWHDVDEAGSWLLDVASLVRPEVVHLNGYCHAALPWGVPTVVVGHSCVLSWWSAVLGSEAPNCWAEYRHRVAAGLRAADAVVTPSHAMLRELQHWYGHVDGRVVPNCRDRRWFDGGRPVKHPVVLTVGRVWDEAKNVGAVARVAERGAIPWTVRVAGETRHPGGGPQSPAGGAVTLLGEIPFDDVAREMTRAAIFVLPARYEPFGLAALEAALAGCALVLGDIPSLRETWQDAALFVDPDDDAALGEALNRLIADPMLRRRAGAAAERRALTFTPERTASGYVDVYRRASRVHASGGER